MFSFFIGFDMKLQKKLKVEKIVQLMTGRQLFVSHQCPTDWNGGHPFTACKPLVDFICGTLETHIQWLLSHQSLGTSSVDKGKKKNTKYLSLGDEHCLYDR